MVLATILLENNRDSAGRGNSHIIWIITNSWANQMQRADSL